LSSPARFIPGVDGMLMNIAVDYIAAAMRGWFSYCDVA
jgi:hypothetical protein